MIFIKTCQNLHTFIRLDCKINDLSLYDFKPIDLQPYSTEYLQCQLCDSTVLCSTWINEINGKSVAVVMIIFFVDQSVLKKSAYFAKTNSAFLEEIKLDWDPLPPHSNKCETLET